MILQLLLSCFLFWYFWASLAKLWCPDKKCHYINNLCIIFHCWSIFQGHIWNSLYLLKSIVKPCSFQRFCAKNVLVWILFDLVKAVLYFSVSRPIILSISLLHLKSKSDVQMLLFIFCDYLFSDFSIFFYCYQ